MPVSDQGNNEDRYTLIPRTLIFVIKENKILLIKGAPNKRLWANKYNGIGGHVEIGEDILSAAKRELLEETGLRQLDNLWLCGTITIDTGEQPGIIVFVYKGESTVGEFKESTEGSLKWISIEQVFTLPLVEDLHTLLPRVLEQKKLSRPFSALYNYDRNDRLQIKFEE